MGTAVNVICALTDRCPLQMLPKGRPCDLTACGRALCDYKKQLSVFFLGLNKPL